MGFFGRLFAKKSGGTRIGRLIRQTAFTYSGGLFGTDYGGAVGAVSGADAQGNGAITW